MFVELEVLEVAGEPVVEGGDLALLVCDAGDDDVAVDDLRFADGAFLGAG